MLHRRYDICKVGRLLRLLGTDAMKEWSLLAAYLCIMSKGCSLTDQRLNNKLCGNVLIVVLTYVISINAIVST